MNLFDILAFDDSAINSLNSAFSMSGRIYGMMLRTARNSSVTMFNDTIQGVVNNFYIIAAVFMLFRIAISVFQYIIEPDKMTDNKVGAGKMLINVVLTVILLIAFYPADKGQFSVYRILNKVEEVVLFQGVDPETGRLKEGSQGGIIDRIFNNVSVDNNCDGSTITAFNDTNKANSFNSQTAFSNFENKLFIENVNAAAKTKTCYFNGDQYQLLSDAEKKRLESAGITKDNVGEKTTGVVFELKNGKFNKIKETKGFKSSSTSSGLTMSKNAKKQSNCENLLLAQEINQRNGISSSRIISKSGDKINDGTVTIKMKNTEEDATKSAEDGTNTDTKRGQADSIAKHGLTEAEGNFANSVAGSFYYCVDGIDADRGKAYCDSIESNESPSNPSCLDFEYRPLYINSAGSEGKKLVKDGKMDYYFIIGILSALIVDALLIWLCVDVIVRNLKLMLFQIIAPIPLINGIDPNDQMRKKWFKAYFGAYLDLFIKIFSIKLLTVLFPIVGQQLGNSEHIIERIFFIFALLTFAKIAPDLIAKILGIDGLSGAGKNAFGMLKKGLGMGAAAGGAVIGGAIGGVVGAMTSKGLGPGAGLTRGLQGALRGVGAGSKKDIFGGAKQIAASNMRDKESGLDFFGRQKAKIQGALGLPDKYEEAKQKKEAYDDFASKASKNNDEGINLSKKLLSKGNSHNFSELAEAYDDAAKIEQGKTVARWRTDSDGNMVDKLTGAKREKNKDGTITFTGKNGNGEKMTRTTNSDGSITFATFDKQGNQISSKVLSNDRSSWSDSDKEFYATNSSVFDTLSDNLTAGEVNTRITGAEKASSKQIRIDMDVMSDQELKSKYIGLSDDDIRKMKTLSDQADSAARQVNLQYKATKGQNGEVIDTYGDKDVAENRSRELSVEMDKASAAHMYGKQ